MAPWMKCALAGLEKLFPLRLAELWDNCGILVDAEDKDEIEDGSIFLTNDLTLPVLEEALALNARLIVTYHPRPFVKFKKIQCNDVTQRIVLRCARKGVVVYSPHTCCDNAAGGVNDWLAEPFRALAAEYGAIEPQKDGLEGEGSGRRVVLREPMTLAGAVAKVKAHVQLERLRVAFAEGLLPSGPTPEGQQAALDGTKVRTILFQAGSGSGVLAGKGGDLWVTGEMGHHDVLAAAAAGSSIVLTEHTNTERGFLPRMGALVKEHLSATGVKGVPIHVSKIDADPLRIV